MDLPGWHFDVFDTGKREGLAFARILFGGSSYRLAQLSLLIGFAYWVGPLDVIPARTPYIGHLDEMCVLIGALTIARRYYRAERVERPCIPSALFDDDLAETEALIGRDLSAWRV